MYSASNFEGMIIEGYRIVQLLGRGSFGEVWKAEGPGGTQAALKFIDLVGKSGLKEFRALQRVKQVRHANLMPITAIWLINENGETLNSEQLEEWSARASSTTANSIRADDPGAPKRMIVAMPLGDMNLLDRLRECQSAGQQGIPVAELFDYMEDAAKGIDYLNSPRHQITSTPVAIQHGDIKPQNITIVGASAQLCDFGLVRVMGDPRVTSMLGSPAYAAPECVQHGTPSRSADQYSLAVSYVELRTGELPFDDQSYTGVLNAHIHSRLNLSRLSDAERTVIRKATDLNPAARYSTVLEMIKALRAAHEATELQASGQASSKDTPGGTLRSSDTNAIVASVVASPRGSGQRAWKNEPRVNRRSWIVVSVVAAAALVIVLGLGSLYRSRKTGPQPGADVAIENFPPELREVNVEPSALVAGGEAQIDLIGSDPEGDPMTYQYRTAPDSPWQSALGKHIRLRDLAAGSMRVQLRARDSHGNVSEPMTRVLSVARPNRAPVAAIASVEPVRPVSDDDMTVRVMGSDPDDDPVTLQFRTGAAGPWQPVDNDMIRFEGLAAGSMTLELRAVDRDGLVSQVVEQSWSVARRNRAPSVAIAKIEPREPLAGDTLYVELDGSDPDDDQVALQYRTGSAGPWRAVRDNQIRFENLRAGTLRLQVRALDPDGLLSQLAERSFSVVRPNRAPRATIASVEPMQPRAGEAIEIELQGTDPDGDSFGFEFRRGDDDVWHRAEGARLTLENVEPGSIELQVRALDERGLASARVRRAIAVLPKRPEISPEEFEIAALPFFEIESDEPLAHRVPTEQVVTPVSASTEVAQVPTPSATQLPTVAKTPVNSVIATKEVAKTTAKPQQAQTPLRRPTTTVSANQVNARYGNSYPGQPSPRRSGSSCSSSRGRCH